MTGGQKDTRDTKIGWLVCLENMVISLCRLRKDSPIFCQHETKRASRSATESMLQAEKAVDFLRLRLMDTWGIKQKELMKWMDLGPDEYRKRMDPSIYSVSRFRGLQSGRIKKSRKR